MSKVKLVFYSSDVSGHNSQMVCHNNNNNEIFISLSDVDGDEYYSQYICLDIPTAIKFSKVLRTAINDAKELAQDG